VRILADVSASGPCRVHWSGAHAIEHSTHFVYHIIDLQSHHIIRYDVTMATNEKLLQAIKEVGDLRERIGATRATLAALESQLVVREREVNALVRTSGKPEKVASQRSAAPALATAAVPAPSVTTPPRQQETRTRPLVLRRGSLASRIVSLLNASPERTFTTAQMAQHFGIEIHQVYGTLSRLARNNLIARVSEGVFRATRGGAAAAA
jgi:hypothetical protein